MSDDKPKTASELLAERQARRAKKSECEAELWAAQKIKDLDALEAVEDTHGSSNIAILDVPYTQGLPACCAVKTPDEIQMKRYRSTGKPKKYDEHVMARMAEANEELAAVTLVYPDKAVFAEMCKARPGIKAQLGQLASALATGKAEAEGKG